jgi:hypothetical protein
MSAPELQLDRDGGFEILWSRERPAGSEGNWLAIHPDARYVQIRQYLTDWERQTPVRFAIQQIGNEGNPAAALTPARMAELLDDAGEWVEVTTRFWTEWVDAMRRAYEPDQLKPAMRFVGGADDIYYGNDWFRLGPEEALIIETELPDARYWAFQLCDVWFRTMDYATRQTSLNQHQARIDADGRFRCVIAHRDPGVPNWLDTSGHPEGMIQYRWIWSHSNPAPRLTRVRFADVRAALPADTPHVTPEERRCRIAGRQIHVARREPA